MNRSDGLASTLGSLRAEGLEPTGQVLAILQAWRNGELTNEQLGEIAHRLGAGRPIDALLPVSVQEALRGLPAEPDEQK